MPNSRRKPPYPTSTIDMDYQIRTLQKKRTTNFREDETKLLISLWGSPVIQNKLYLTHRKAPVMRLLAANMQQRGFNRSPDEIKTRIRNLKCLYHRIKRTMVTGSGIGTVDPDWPHFKAMDAILGKEGSSPKHVDKKPPPSEDSLLEGPRCEDIKQEIDLDINEDLESWQGNESGGSDYEDNHIPATTIPKPTTTTDPETSRPSVPVTQQYQPILPNITIPQPPSLRPNGNMSSIPLPLLILNHSNLQENKNSTCGNNGKTPNDTPSENVNVPPDLNNILREMVQIQKQQLELEKQRFEMEKQRLEFDRVVGSQLMTLVPMVGGLLQRLVYPTVSNSNPTPSESSTENNEADPKTDDKLETDYDILKDSKILRTVLERGIKKYMMSDETRDSNKDGEEESDNEDSGLNQSDSMAIDNENSRDSSK